MMYSNGCTTAASSIIRRHITTTIHARNNNSRHYIWCNKKQQHDLLRSSISFFSTTTSSSSSATEEDNDKQSKKKVEKMRIAIVGGGAAGLSTALHLAPLVSKGIIEGPVDLYESLCPDSPHPSVEVLKKKKKGGSASNDTGEQEKQKKNKMVKTEADWPDEYPGSGPVGRSIGVGIWSTALAPFRTSNHPTHRHLLDALESSGSYVGRVGYRTPTGRWLARSELDTTGLHRHQPALLFLPEKDLLTSLKEAVRMEEEQFGTIRTHYGSPLATTPTTVEEIHIPPKSIHSLGRLTFSDGTLSSPSTPYHLIVGADGMHSKLRSHYAGHFFKKQKSSVVVSQDRIDDWDKSDQEECNAVEDRQYTVFRGCSPMTIKEMGADGYSFQTWGEGDSMRFAVVSMVHPTSSSDKGNKKEEQVWFITTSDPKISSESDASVRKKLLMKKFQNWHDPIGRLIESTPPDDILMERALAHRHSVGPVFNVAEIALHELELNERRNKRKKYGFEHLDIGEKNRALKESPNLGPALFFVGDANMTVDPVLAQGLTMAMEGGHALSKSVERCCFKAASSPLYRSTNLNVAHSDEDEEIIPLNFDPYQLRDELRYQHKKLGARLLCLLRATELVQTMGQPHSALSGFIFKGVMRPAMRLTPDFLKKPIFDYVLKYSLGLTGETVETVKDEHSVSEIGTNR